jgi:SAM-dependent methyltransferase
MDSKTRKMLEKHALEVQKKLQRAKDVLSKPVPMAGKMHEILEEDERPTARIEIRTLSSKEPGFHLDALHNIFEGNPERVLAPGIYTVLLTKCKPTPDNGTGWEIMMSDAPYEIRSSMEFIEKACGRVLVAGLGLGATLVPLLRKNSVKDVTVLEKSQDVIDLVAHQIRRVRGGNKLHVMQADALTWKPDNKSWKWNTIWLDIWPSVTRGNLLEMQLMKKKYSKLLEPKGWIGVWEWDRVHRQQVEYEEIQRMIYGPVGGPLKEEKPNCVEVPGVGIVRLSE